MSREEVGGGHNEQEVERRQSTDDGRLHNDHVSVREGRPKERVRDDRGRRERSIEEDWAEGGREGRWTQSTRARGK